MEKFLEDLESLLWTAFRWSLRAFLAFMAFVGLLLAVGTIIS